MFRFALITATLLREGAWQRHDQVSTEQEPEEWR